MTARVGVAGEELVLLPERAALWVAAGTLLVADPHFGKAAAFRARGLPVPRGTTTSGLARLDAMLARTGARGIIFLGDFLHARAGRAPETLAALAEWRASHPEIELLLVRGNHDRQAGDPPSELGIECVDEPFTAAPFVLVHCPRAFDAGYAIGGHLHPGVRLLGPGRQRERLPCFWFASRVGVLPAFGEFTGLADVSPQPRERVFVVAGDLVTEVR